MFHVLLVAHVSGSSQGTIIHATGISAGATNMHVSTVHPTRGPHVSKYQILVAQGSTVHVRTTNFDYLPVVCFGEVARYANYDKYEVCV